MSNNKPGPGSWVGKQVRNIDGRTGTIVDDSPGYAHRTLVIEVPGRAQAFIQLNNNGRDEGERGWEWNCAGFDGGERWLKLGNQPSVVAFEGHAINGPGTAWGVLNAEAILYEPMFHEMTAKRLAALCALFPENGWEVHVKILEDEGFSTDDPAEQRARLRIMAEG